MVMGNSVITTVTRVFTVGTINILPGVKVKMMALSEARGETLGNYRCSGNAKEDVMLPLFTVF